MSVLSRALSVTMIACVPSSMGSDRLPVRVLSEITQFTPASDWYSLTKTHPYWEIGVNLARNAQFPGYPLSLSDETDPSNPRSLNLKPGTAELIGEPKPGSFPDRYTGDVVISRVAEPTDGSITRSRVMNNDFTLLCVNSEQCAIVNRKNSKKTAVKIPEGVDSKSIIVISESLLAYKDDRNKENARLIVGEIQKDATLKEKTSMSLPQWTEYAIRKAANKNSLEALILEQHSDTDFELRVYDVLNPDANHHSLQICFPSDFSSPGFKFSNDGSVLASVKIDHGDEGGSHAAKIRVYDTQSGSLIYDLKKTLVGVFSAMSISDDSRHIAIGMREDDHSLYLRWYMLDLSREINWKFACSGALMWCSEDLFITMDELQCAQLRSAKQLGMVISKRSCSMAAPTADITLDQPVSLQSIHSFCIFLDGGMMTNMLNKKLYHLRFPIK